MKNLSSKILYHLEHQNLIKPNPCQVKATKKISENLKANLEKRLLNLFQKKFIGIYMFGSVGVGKSLILKAIHFVYSKSEIFHFTDLMFNLQNLHEKKFRSLMMKKKLILIDEFYINNLTNLILFKNFLEETIKEKKILIMTGNKELSNIYKDPTNKELCNSFKDFLNKNFTKIKMSSKVDYRKKGFVNHNFFILKQKNSKRLLNTIKKKLAINSINTEAVFKRKGFFFSLKGYYGNLLDLNFKEFFENNFEFQDYLLIARKINFVILRNVNQMNENNKNFLYRFIMFIDALYENKVVLSLSSDVELGKLYLGKTNAFEFKRTLSRLEEMGSNSYINKHIKRINKKR